LKKLTKNPELFKNLLLSVGKQGRGSTQKQPLSPIEVAKLIKRFKEEENIDSHRVSERLGLGRTRDITKKLYEKTDKTQVEFFLKLLELSPAIREFCAWDWEKGIDRINMTTLFRLNALKHEEQNQIVQAIRNQKRQFEKSNGEAPKPLTSKEALKISQDRRENPQIPIQEYIDKVIGIRPVEEIHNFVVCIMGKKLAKFVETNEDHVDKLLSILRNSLDGIFYDINAENGRTITIEMDPVGLKIFDKQEAENGATYSQFLNKFLEDKID
tara:strand:- start:4253 stop:5062 length:810 start_codon:yes stop_codon:yes gene_type:complete